MTEPADRPAPLPAKLLFAAGIATVAVGRVVGRRRDVDADDQGQPELEDGTDRVIDV